MKRTLTIAGLGVAGMALAVALSVAAFALVGEPLERAGHGDPGADRDGVEQPERRRHANEDAGSGDALTQHVTRGRPRR